MSSIVCWFVGHQWLLRYKTPIFVYLENDKEAKSLYHYECQRCSVWSQDVVVDLDNQPKAHHE